MLNMLRDVVAPSCSILITPEKITILQHAGPPLQSQEQDESWCQICSKPVLKSCCSYDYSFPVTQMNQVSHSLVGYIKDTLVSTIDSACVDQGLATDAICFSVPSPASVSLPIL